MKEELTARVDEMREARAERIRSLARFLDSAVRIPGTGVRVGADSIFGIVPVVGDIAGAALSGYIVLASARLGAPPTTLIRMLVNIAIDTLVGAVPILGDMFDVGWRANIRNAELLDKHLARDQREYRVSRYITIAVLVGLLLLSAGAVWLGIEGIRLLVQHLATQRSSS